MATRKIFTSAFPTQTLRDEPALPEAPEPSPVVESVPQAPPEPAVNPLQARVTELERQNLLLRQAHAEVSEKLARYAQHLRTAVPGCSW